MFNDTNEHKEKFKALLARKPDTGSFLESVDGEPVPVHIDMKPDRGGGETRVMFVRAVIDDACTGWFLGGDSRGLNCLLTRESQVKLIERNGGKTTEGLTVTDLYVIRQNFRGTALICELTQ